LIDLETGLYLLPNPNICITAVGFASRVNQMLGTKSQPYSKVVLCMPETLVCNRTKEVFSQSVTTTCLQVTYIVQ